MSSDAVLGLGGGIDWETSWDPAVLQRLAASFDIGVDELRDAGDVGSLRDLVVSVLSHLRAGTGGEYYADNAVITEYANHVEHRTTLGGTGVRAAIAMNAVGKPATVHLAAVSPQLAQLLPADTDHIAGGRREHSDPHLIIQFPAHATVRIGATELTAPVANRLIYTGDRASRDFGLSPQLGEALATARVFLISGFNAIQSEDAALRRIAELTEAMTSLPADATVIYEDAGFHVPELSRVVRERLAGRIQLYSLNEDELAGHLGRSVELLDPDDLCAAIERLHCMIDAEVIILHTKYFAIAHGDRATELRRPLDCGVTMAAGRYLHGDHLDREQLETLRAGTPRRADSARLLRAVAERLGSGVSFVAAYALEDVTAPTTIGLGDFFVGGMIAGLLAGSDHCNAEVSRRALSR